MRTVLSTILLSGAALLAAGAAPATVEAQRTGSAARGTVGTVGTARPWTGDAGWRGAGRPGRASGWVGDPGRGRADWRADFRLRYPDPRYRAPVRRTHYDYARYYAPFVYYSPAVVYVPPTTTREVHVQTAMVRPRTIVLSPEATAARETCVVVSVLAPDHRGYWKELRLPAAGAHNTDELQRILDARIEEGVPFTVRDADGATIEIPAGAALDRVIVDRCD